MGNYLKILEIYPCVYSESAGPGTEEKWGFRDLVGVLVQGLKRNGIQEPSRSAVQGPRRSGIQEPSRSAGPGTKKECWSRDRGVVLVQGQRKSVGPGSEEEC